MVRVIACRAEGPGSIPSYYLGVLIKHLEIVSTNFSGCFASTRLYKGKEKTEGGRIFCVHLNQLERRHETGAPSFTAQMDMTDSVMDSAIVSHAVGPGSKPASPCVLTTNFLKCAAFLHTHVRRYKCK